MATHTSLAETDDALRQVELFKKPVATLAIVPKTGAITRVGRQAYTIMMLMARDQEADKEGFYTAPVSAIMKGFEGAEGSREELKRHLKSMVTHVIEWQSPTADEAAAWRACPLLSEVRIDKKNNENWVSWAYPPSLRTELLSPERYAQLQRSSISKFRTHAGLALYEICARYKDNPSKVTPRQKWRWWLPVLTGKPVAETQKTEFRFFNRDTLKPAIEEVNEVSELTIELNEFKVGRSVDELQFVITQKKQVEKAAELRKPDIAALSKAIGLGIDAEVAEDLYLKYGDFNFAVAVAKLADQIERGTSVVSKSAYLRKILSNTGVPSGQRVELIDVVTPSKVREEGRAQSSSQSGSVTPTTTVAVLESAEATRTKKIREELLSMVQEELQELLAELAVDMTNRGVSKPTIERLKAGKWESALVLGELMRFYWKKTRGSEWTTI